MGDLNPYRQQNDYMTLSIYDFLETLVEAIRPAETIRSSEGPQLETNIKPGGYSEDIFIFLSDRERDEYSCGVCYSVLKDAHQCTNGHKFCYSCIYVWSTSDRSAADACPACRCDGVYARNEQINERLNRKRVKCHDEGCNWRGFLCDFNEHEHRTYDFRELKNSIELPSLMKLNTNTSSFISSSNVTSNSNNDSISSPVGGNMSNLSTETVATTNTATHESPTPSRPSVIRTQLAPRRLTSRISDLHHRTSVPTVSNGNNNRLSMNRINQSPRISGGIHTQAGTVNGNVRCTRLNRANITNDLQSSVMPPLHNGSRDNVVATSPRLSVAGINEGSMENTTINNNTVPTLPSINNSRSHSLNTSTSPSMEYRRLAPTYADRRRNNLSDGREQLAMMLILLTSDLDDRYNSATDHTYSAPGSRLPNSSGPDSHLNNSNNNNNQRTTINSSTLSSPVSNTATTSTTTGPQPPRLGRSRLQEFRNLNRRLSEVANSLDRLIESTSRDSAQITNNYRNYDSNNRRDSEISHSNIDNNISSDSSTNNSLSDLNEHNL